MRKYKNQIIWGLLITVTIYISMLMLADNQGVLKAEGVVDALQSFPLMWIFPLIGFQLWVIFFRFLEWHYYLGVIGARDKISLFDSLLIFVSMFTMVVSPGKTAELLKSVLLRSKSGVPVAQSAPIVVAERVVDGLAVIALMALTLGIAGDQLNLGMYNGIDYRILSETIIFSSLLIIIGGLIVIQIRPLAYFALGVIARIPFVKRLHKPLTEFYESSREIFRLRHVIPMTFVGIGVYASTTAGFIVILYGFGLDLSTQLFMQSAFIIGVSSAIGALSFVPNGAGVTEISNTGMLLALVAPLNPVVTPAVAAAAALLQGFFHKWFRVLVGLMIGFIFRKRLFSGEIETLLIESESDPA